jgi:hypothetical protein
MYVRGQAGVGINPSSELDVIGVYRRTRKDEVRLRHLRPYQRSGRQHAGMILLRIESGDYTNQERIRWQTQFNT